MKKTKLLTKPIRVSEISFDELYDAMSSDWELKAERLQARRWRKLRHQLI